MGAARVTGRLAGLVLLTTSAAVSLPFVVARAGAGSSLAVSTAERRPGPTGALPHVIVARPDGRPPTDRAQVPAGAAASASPSPAAAAPAHTTPVSQVGSRPAPVAPAPPVAPPVGLPAGATGSGWQAQRGAAALALIGYPWQRLGYTISFEPARAGYYGLTTPDTRTIHVYVRESESVAYVARIVAHELGHAVDVTYDNGDRRARYLALRGITPRDWWACDACTDFSAPAGDYAEVFAYWLVHQADFRSRLAPPPPAAQLASLAPLFGP